MTTALLYVGGIIFFVLAILISIGLHELGHMIPAKKFGAKVSQYFVGFGPTIWSKQKGETEYGVKAIPLGGFVRILGMMPPGKEEQAKLDGLQDDEAVQLRGTDTGMFTSLITSARQTEYAEITAADKDRLFYRLPWWKKLIVMGAGPTVNVAIAFLIFCGIFSFYGHEEYQVKEGTPVVSAVAQCSTGAYGNDGGDCSEEAYAPARKAGLQPGDFVTAFNGQPTKNWEHFTSLVAANPGQEVTLEVVRDGEKLELTLPIGERIDPETGEKGIGYAGIYPAVDRTVIKEGPLYTVVWMGDQTKEVLKSLKDIPPKVYNVLKATFGIEERDPNGPVSIVGGARFSGEIASYEPPANAGPGTPKIVSMLMLVGVFNLFIGIFNFLPLLPLDGGHMVGALWEGVKSFFAKLTRRDAPAPVDVAKMLPIAYVVGLSLFALGFILIVGDVVAPINLY